MFPQQQGKKFINQPYRSSLARDRNRQTQSHNRCNYFPADLLTEGLVAKLAAPLTGEGKPILLDLQSSIDET